MRLKPTDVNSTKVLVFPHGNNPSLRARGAANILVQNECQARMSSMTSENNKSPTTLNERERGMPWNAYVRKDTPSSYVRLDRQRETFGCHRVRMGENGYALTSPLVSAVALGRPWSPSVIAFRLLVALGHARLTSVY